MSPLVIPFWDSCPSADTWLLGVDFLDRIARQSRRAGFGEVIVRPGSDDIRKLPERFLIVFPNLLLSDRGWKRLHSLEADCDTLTALSTSDSIALIRSKDADLIRAAFAASRNYPELLSRLRSRLRSDYMGVEGSDSVVFRSERDREDVETWLLRGLIKDSEGFMSRYLERRISLAVSRRLAKTRVTPDTMTLVSVGIGIIGAVFFVFPRRRSHVLGALLLWLHSVLDGCDGELARLKFAESRRGGLLDFWGDNVVHSAVFLAIALRLYLDRSRALASSLAALSMGGTLFSAGFVYWTTMRRKPSEGPLFASVVDSTLVKPGELAAAERIADQLARRDFIYLVVALAVLGKVRWFLWMGAVGAPIYFLALTAFKLKNRPASRQQNPIAQNSQ
jgi:phosphatidylglycerophosphate synthase